LRFLSCVCELCRKVYRHSVTSQSIFSNFSTFLFGVLRFGQVRFIAVASGAGKPPVRRFVFAAAAYGRCMVDRAPQVFGAVADVYRLAAIVADLGACDRPPTARRILRRSCAEPVPAVRFEVLAHRPPYL
jgi:hypothetical protein